MSWDYSDLSHKASIHGGPEKYIRLIRSHERQLTTHNINKKWLQGAIPTLCLLVPFAVKGMYDVVKKRKCKQIIEENEAKQAEKDLIEYIENNPEYMCEEGLIDDR